MGRIIQKNNGMTTIFTSGEDISLITGQPDTYVLGIDPNTGLYEKLNPDGVTVDLEKDSSGITGGTLSGTTLILDNSGGGNINISLSGLSTGGGISSNLYEVTYSGLTTHISNSTLSGGSYYMVTDFATIYDQPDYFIDGSSKGVGSVNTYTGMTEPIIVLATSENTLSIDAYQPTYPKDKIKYDWSWSNTEINGTPTYGRISERIDEYENRTDYDHRTINFLRYQGYETGTTLTGTINEYDCTTGVMLGNGTLFSGELTTGSTILLDSKNYIGYQVGVKVVNIIDDTTMDVVIDSGYTSTIFTIGNGYDFNFYTLNGTGSYYEYKEVYIGQRNEEGYNEYNTFILDGGSLSNYIGDYSVFYINGAYSNSGFLLANNVFGSNSYSNTIGDRSYNNTTWSWFVRNDIAGRFYSNKITSGFYSNDIGEYFYDNKIYGQFYRNHIGEEFYGNITYDSFQNNLLGNGFNTNIINGTFYKNEIGNGFNGNNVGDQFFGNDIGNGFNDNIIGTYFINNNILEYFNNNTISYNFGYNKIGTYFNNNTIGSDFGYGGSQAQGNVIGDGFEYNIIGQYCYNNIIGNFFNNNIIGVEFEHNQIQNYFIGNTISTGFTSNQIGNYFGNNGSAGAQIQNNIFNDFKYNKIGNFFGNDTNFPTIGGGTNGDGGNIINDGFQYNEIGDNFIWNGMDLSFNNNKIGNDFWFNLFGINTTDNIIGNLFVANSGGGFGVPIGNGFISNKLGNYSGYNIIGADFKNNEIGDYFGNAGPVPNEIANNFNNNKIGNYFGNDGTTTAGGNVINNNFYDNLIGNKFYSNTIDPLFYRNDIGNEFHDNTIQDIPGGSYFQNNEIGNKFNNNTTDGYFYGNQIGGGFNNNGIGNDVYSNVIGYGFNGNTIGEAFYTNTIDYYFQNNTVIENFYKNNIEAYFGSNTIAINFNSNKIKTQIGAVDFTAFYGNITGFTYSAPGSSAGDGLYLLSQDSTSNIGVNATFDIEVSSGAVIGVTGNTQGKLYAISNTLTILGNQINGIDGVDDVVITVTGISPLPSVYETYTCDIFERQGGTKRLSYYDSSDILTITNINE